jgi:biotin carboxylase
MRPRVLLLVSKTSYRTEAFVSAARQLGVDVVLGSDRCHVLAREWSDEAFARVLGDVAGSIALETRQPEEALAAILRESSHIPPRALRFPIDVPEGELVRAVECEIGYPCVAKPLLLSASRGVIRADHAPDLMIARTRIQAILRTRAEWTDGVLDGRALLVERYVPAGRRGEVALEGILDGGRLVTLAIYDKPDPLEGPYFEETIYVTPSLHAPEVLRAVEAVTARAAAAIGLSEGPIHAELRLSPDGPVVIEVAARSIGGLCARTLRFTLGEEGEHALEDLVLRQALGMTAPSPRRSEQAAGVMMIPIPAAGVLRAVAGTEDAKAVVGIEDVVITAKTGEHVQPLPEGGSYFGFIFARGAEPVAVEQALRDAHARLVFDISPTL